MKREISLDPDYRPWDGGVLVALRKKKSPLLFFVLMGLALIVGVYLTESSRSKNAVAITAATPTPVGILSEAPPEPERFVCPAPVGVSGHVTLVYHDGCASTRIPCTEFRLGEHAGGTQRGPVINVQGPVVHMVCDGGELEIALP